MTNVELTAEARKLDAEAPSAHYYAIAKNIDAPEVTPQDAWIARARTLLPQLADALEKAIEDGEDWHGNFTGMISVEASLRLDLEAECTRRERAERSAKGWEQDALLHATNEGNERRRRKKVEVVLREIADDPHQTLDNVDADERVDVYKSGIQDGHRCAGNKARRYFEEVKE